MITRAQLTDAIKLTSDGQPMNVAYVQSVKLLRDIATGAVEVEELCPGSGEPGDAYGECSVCNAEAPVMPDHVPYTRRILGE